MQYAANLAFMLQLSCNMQQLKSIGPDNDLSTLNTPKTPNSLISALMEHY